MENEYKNDSDGHGTSRLDEISRLSANILSLLSSLRIERDEPTSVQNADIIDLTLDDDGSSQPSIPVIDIATSPGVVRHNSNGIKPHRGRPKVPDCIICLSSMNKPFSTVCGHMFCELCIKKSLTLSNKCPFCCKRLNFSDIHRIYF